MRLFLVLINIFSSSSMLFEIIAVSSAYSYESASLSGSLSNSFNQEQVEEWNLLSDSNRAQFKISANLRKDVLDDNGNRIQDEFKIPEAIRPSVEFWFRIYSEFSHEQVVLFDERHPEIIYEILDFSQLKATNKNAVVYEILRERELKRKFTSYRRAFSRLRTKGTTSRVKNIETTNIISAIRKLKHKHSFSELSKNLRAQTGQRDSVINGLVLSAPYLNKMEDIFFAYGIPIELTRLSLVESSFNLNAISRVGATGVWQFMLRSSHEYMLVDRKRMIDERLSPLKATAAAAQLLKRNRKILGSWALAISSYNSGVKPFIKIPLKVRESARVSYLKSCPGTYRIGWAGRNYYPEFLALLYAEKYRDLVFSDVGKPSNHFISFMTIPSSSTLTEVAMNSAFSLFDLESLNPDVLDAQIKLPKGFRLAIPADRDDLHHLLSREWLVSLVRYQRGRSGG